ncbi:hypothetical protein AX16_000084 [Volvariella volvacea WC 439]|nr:hypothetical protein AX16_000084 [Volvariella volvacea WC 439]
MPDTTLYDFFPRIDKHQTSAKRRIRSNQRSNDETPPPLKKAKKDGVNRYQGLGGAFSRSSSIRDSLSRSTTPVPMTKSLSGNLDPPASNAHTSHSGAEVDLMHKPQGIPVRHVPTVPGSALAGGTSLQTPPPTSRPQKKRFKGIHDPLFDPLSLPRFPPLSLPSPQLGGLMRSSKMGESPGPANGGPQSRLSPQSIVMGETEDGNIALPSNDKSTPHSPLIPSRSPDYHDPPSQSGDDFVALDLSIDSDMHTVPSSQTQLLGPHLVSPNLRGRMQLPPTSTPYHDDPGDHDIVQSSQSIEKELNMTRGLSQLLPTSPVAVVSAPRQKQKPDYRTEKEVLTPSSSIPWQSSQPNPPPRNHSEVLFAFPTQDPDIASLFLDEAEDQEDVELPLSTPRSDSATESDTDNDEEFSKNISQLRRVNNYVPRNVTQSQAINPKPPLTPARVSEQSRTDYTSPSTQSSNSTSVHSLPDVVKDFRDMFDNEGGSYPPDFPEDLR